MDRYATSHTAHIRMKTTSRRRNATIDSTIDTDMGVNIGGYTKVATCMVGVDVWWVDFNVSMMGVANGKVTVVVMRHVCKNLWWKHGTL